MIVRPHHMWDAMSSDDAMVKHESTQHSSATGLGTGLGCTM